VMDDENNQQDPSGADDDTYVIEDTGQTIDEIENEMERTAHEAVQEPGAAPAAAGGDDAEEKRQLHDRYLRTLADFENFRRRMEREKADFHRYALTNVIKDLLPVLDNFDRALEHAEEGDDFHKGVSLIYKQLFDVLKRNGVRTIEETNVPFDPNIHEAVIREEDSTVPSHTVTMVLQKGYFLHDRLLRPAMVKVAVGGE